VLDALGRWARARRPADSADPADTPGPPDAPTARAAVALVLRRAASGAELLLIKRAEHEDDPWSGHVALPGGRQEPRDATLAETAIRETREETGIDLARHGRVLGALDDLEPRSGMSLLVRPFVAILGHDVALTLNDEVAAAFWVPLATLVAPESSTESIVHVRGVARRVRSFRHGEYVVWGMTERVLRQLLAVLSLPTFQ